MTGTSPTPGPQPRLSLATLSRLPGRYRPAVAPGEVAVRIVHLGIGAFHRAHQAAYTEDANVASGERWGICGVTQRSPAVVSQLAPQDGLYSLITRDGDGESVRVMSAVREVLWAKEGVEKVLDRLSDPATAVVTLTVTEKGYRMGPTGRLRLDDAEVAADLAGRQPGTVVGQLAEGLARRAARDAGPLTVISCDNLTDNGQVLRALVHDYCEQRAGGTRLWGWVEKEVTFPCCVVDRIVPATTTADLAAAARVLGVRDEGAVVAEPFRQWVVEDRFASHRPPWERAGAVLTTRVAPYERAKIRLLNGAHSTIAYLGALAGHEYIADAARDGSPIGEVARRFMERDVVPTLEVPEGLDLQGYQADVMTRFQNPGIFYPTLQVAMDGSQKLPPRLLGTIADRRAQGALPLWAVLGVAAWARFVSARVSDDGRPLAVDDPLAARLAAAVAGAVSPGAVVNGLLGVEEVFGPAIRDDVELRRLLVELVGRLARDGAGTTAAALTSEAS